SFIYMLYLHDALPILYLYFNSVEHFDYSEMLDQTIRNYVPNDMTEETKGILLEKLETLPQEKGFDRQFSTVPTVIKSSMRKTYEDRKSTRLNSSHVSI